MPVRRASSHTSGSTLGGRLSTTYQPRSSRLSAAVERPAPDMPLTTTRRNGLTAVSAAPFPAGSAPGTGTLEVLATTGSSTGGVGAVAVSVLTPPLSAPPPPPQPYAPTNRRNGAAGDVHSRARLDRRRRGDEQQTGARAAATTTLKAVARTTASSVDGPGGSTGAAGPERTRRDRAVRMVARRRRPSGRRQQTSATRLSAPRAPRRSPCRSPHPPASHRARL